MEKIKVLFLAADPSDSARLRLGQELRDIRDKLQLSKERDFFFLESRESVRPTDITQSIFDVEPQIVHFSGHGLSTGELCFEDILGKTQPVQTDALANLFELVAEQVNCVVLNACYSEAQAQVIAEHVPFVVGMSDAIGDKAAIAFATGFYKALGAGQTFEKAFKFACVEIQLEGIPEHLTPVMHKKKANQLETEEEDLGYLDGSFLDSQFVRLLKEAKKIGLYKEESKRNLSFSQLRTLRRFKERLRSLKIVNFQLIELANIASSLVGETLQSLDDKRKRDSRYEDQFQLLNRFSKSLEAGKEAALWLKDHREVLSVKAGNFALGNYDGINDKQRSKFHLNIKQFLERLGHSLRWGKYDVLDIADIPLHLDVSIYKLAFEYIRNEKIPPHLSEAAQQQMKHSIDYLVYRVF